MPYANLQSEAAKASRRAAVKRYIESEHGKAKRKTYYAHYIQTERYSAIRKACAARYQNTDKGRERIRQSNASYRQQFPDRLKANKAANHAINNGTLTRQPCEICGNPKSEFHHDDYSKPLEWRHLCRRCHKRLHLEERGG